MLFPDHRCRRYDLGLGKSPASAIQLPSSQARLVQAQSEEIAQDNMVAGAVAPPVNALQSSLGVIHDVHIAQATDATAPVSATPTQAQATSTICPPQPQQVVCDVAQSMQSAMSLPVHINDEATLPAQPEPHERQGPHDANLTTWTQPSVGSGSDEATQQPALIQLSVGSGSDEATQPALTQPSVGSGHDEATGGGK